MGLFSNNAAVRPDPGSVARIKEWVREEFRLDGDAIITVSELRCSETGCPDVETVVGLLLGPGRQRKCRFLSPAGQVTRDQVAEAAQPWLAELSKTNPST